MSNVVVFDRLNGSKGELFSPWEVARTAQEVIDSLLFSFDLDYDEIVERIEIFGSRAEHPFDPVPEGHDIDIRVVFKDTAPRWLQAITLDKWPRGAFDWDSSLLRQAAASFNPRVNGGTLLGMFLFQAIIGQIVMGNGMSFEEARKAARLVDIHFVMDEWEQPSCWDDTPRKKRWRRWRKDFLNRHKVLTLLVPRFAFLAEMASRAAYSYEPLFQKLI